MIATLHRRSDWYWETAIAYRNIAFVQYWSAIQQLEAAVQAGCSEDELRYHRRAANAAQDRYYQERTNLIRLKVERREHA